ncbi:28S ribosomal protein S29, mitochondrial-like [Actinia tenebrosa]|uniref:Small ribosomal subunit protein mS29 n=1 Tax=Actinia tenebrosa TaxID=6105 RepID=A0A6P8IGZ3_ACTTE|nr:28S ribosomal protein S29, mitochondrial-like [Actinia tenebrosa]
MAAAGVFMKSLNPGRTCFSQKVITQNIWRVFSSNAATKRNPEISVVIQENDPNQHSNAHLGHFYRLPESDVSNTLLHCLPKRFFKRSGSEKGNLYLMVRKPALQVIEQLKGWTPGEPQPKFVFYGEPGCGKTLSLSQVVHAAMKTGMFILLVPSVFSWVHSKNGIQLSKSRENRFDQPEESAKWLKTIRDINTDYLSKITTSEKYTWGKLDSTGKGKSLLNVIDQGLKRIDYAPDVVGVVLKELKKESSLKFLFAVDEFNGFFGKTSFKDTKDKWIKPKELSIVHHFTKLLDADKGLQNAVMVFALSRTGIQRNHSKSYEVSDLLGQKGESAVTPLTSVRVPEYSMHELEMCLKFYQENGFSKELNSDVIKEIAMLTGRRGHDVDLICRSR